MTHGNVILIDSIIPDLQTYILTHPNHFKITYENVDIVTDTDFINELRMMYRQMSFLTYDDNHLGGFLELWDLYLARHDSEYQYIYNTFINTAIDNSAYDYYANETATPDLTTETTYGKVSTDGGTVTSETEYDSDTTTQTNTYDGQLRDSGKTTKGGSDTTTNTLDNSTTLSGTDSTTTSGTNTIEKYGYKSNPFDNMEKAISYIWRYNLRDLILNNFAREMLFYDNDNGGFVI